MRIELILENPRPDSGVTVPLGYNHALASCIYQTLAASSADYSEELHDRGVPFQGKHFKLFTFSQLLADRRRVMGDRLHLLSPIIRWLVSSPVDEFVIHFANGILERGIVRAHDVQFRVREVRTLAPPTFTSKMRFTCLSPITVSTHIDVPGLNPLQYCRLENGFYEKVAENLKRKYALLALDQSEPNSSLVTRHSSITMSFDPDYLARKQGRIHKLIRYKNTDIFGYLAPFRVKGDADLIRIGYECGFGDGNSKGFGMVEIDGRDTA
jgi:CRISPR-associated endoribonuclease Cas6